MTWWIGGGLLALLLFASLAFWLAGRVAGADDQRLERTKPQRELRKTDLL